MRPALYASACMSTCRGICLMRSHIFKVPRGISFSKVSFTPRQRKFFSSLVMRLSELISAAAPGNALTQSTGVLKVSCTQMMLIPARAELTLPRRSCSWDSSPQTRMLVCALTQTMFSLWLRSMNSASSSAPTLFSALFCMEVILLFLPSISLLFSCWLMVKI